MGTTNNDWKLGQAALKMLSADYCGNGTPFTVTGEPLVWRSLSGMDFNTTPTDLEARWDQNGARCLDVPRALVTRNPAMARAFPDIETAIAQTCPRPPRCANSDPFVDDPGDHVTSANYDR
jgi:hypothetical protein